MSELPKGWEFKQLKDLFSFVLGGDWGKDPEYPDEDFETVYCIRGTEFRNWKKEKGLTSVKRKVKSSSIEKRKLQEGDILIEISGGGPDQPVGRTILIDKQALKVHENTSLVCTNFIRLARPQDSVSSRYLNYYLQSFYLSGEVTKYQGGSNNLRNLKFKEYEKIEVPLAPFEEQKRIADKLDSVLAKVEAAQARLDKIPAILKRFRQSVLAAATSGELTKDWREKNKILWEPVESSLGEIADITGGVTKNSKRAGFPLKRPYLRVANVYENEIRLSEVKEIGLMEKELDRVTLKHNDLLVVEGNGSIEQIGRVALWQSEIANCVHQNHLIKVRSLPDLILPQFLLYYLMSPAGKEIIREKATSGAGLYTLSISKVSSIEIHYPDVIEQRKIINKTEELFERASAIEKQYKAAKSNLDRLTQSILAKAFKGELLSSSVYSYIDSIESSVEALNA